jgi:transcriptional regulator with XRE-family HTH domain
VSDKKSVGEIIRSERKRLGLSQKQLAAKMGKKQSYISQVENGVYIPTLDTLHLFAKAGIRLTEIFESDESEPLSLAS